MKVRLHYRGHDVIVQHPKKGIDGRYTITIGNLVRARLYVKRLRFPEKKIRVLWDKDYGPRFTRLLQGALKQFFREHETLFFSRTMVSERW
jgi:hypothetical protein